LLYEIFLVLKVPFLLFPFSYCLVLQVVLPYAIFT
jgi:hypothetical protein